MKHLLLLLLVVMLPAVERGDPRGLKLLEKHEIPRITSKTIPSALTSNDVVICNVEYEHFQSLPGCLREWEIINNKTQQCFFNLTKAQIREVFTKIPSNGSIYFMGHGLRNHHNQYTVLGCDSLDEKDGVPVNVICKRVYISACESNYFRQNVGSQSFQVYTSDVGGKNMNDDDLAFARLFVDGHMSNERYVLYYRFVNRILDESIITYDGLNFTVGVRKPIVETEIRYVYASEPDPTSDEKSLIKDRQARAESDLRTMREKLKKAEDKATIQDNYSRKFSDSMSPERERIYMSLRAKCDKIRAEIAEYERVNHSILFP